MVSKSRHQYLGSGINTSLHQTDSGEVLIFKFPDGHIESLPHESVQTLRGIFAEIDAGKEAQS